MKGHGFQALYLGHVFVYVLMYHCEVRNIIQLYFLPWLIIKPNMVRNLSTFCLKRLLGCGALFCTFSDHVSNHLIINPENITVEAIKNHNSF